MGLNDRKECKQFKYEKGIRGTTFLDFVESADHLSYSRSIGTICRKFDTNRFGAIMELTRLMNV